MVGFDFADGEWLGFAEGWLVVGATASNNDFERVNGAAKFYNAIIMRRIYIISKMKINCLLLVSTTEEAERCSKNWLELRI